MNTQNRILNTHQLVLAASNYHRPRPQLLSPMGWFAVLAFGAVVAGALLGFAT